MSDVKYWIVVVDDDVSNLMMAGSVMSKNGMRVTALKSGKALLEYIENNEIPDLCLLDVKMPDMNGFETLKALRASKKGKDLPVVFLTADESERSETMGLSLGAMDFIKKPFAPEVLILRAQHIIDLVRLQKNLAHEVEVNIKENHNLFIHVVSALAAAIDKKDINNSKGHSLRVAEYAKEIAKRYGYSERKQNDIYIMGLLHDVGKINVQYKEHPVIGAQILSSVKEMPSLALAAKYHHENYDGSGYPDGLSGEKIPEPARIIAVANSYDLITDRDEIEKGRGTQFDPKFVDIMLKIIDEGK
ncbi:MAG: response regulator [Synergistaceae bacterium]|nr:response regulator [Synergistaceae bacterium]